MGDQRVQQRFSVRGVEEQGVAAHFHACRQLAQRAVHQRGGAQAIDLDHLGFQMRGDQLARFAFGNLAAMVQHQQARAQALGLVHEMGGQQNRFALLQQQLQPLPHQVPGLRVQARGRLVQQQQLGVVDERTRQAQAPLHAAGQLAGLGLGLVRQRREGQQLRDARAYRGVGHTEVAAINQQVLGAAEIRVQRVHLADHAQLALDRQRVVRHAEAKGADAARIGLGLAQAHAQRGGLASAVGTDHAQAFTGGNVEAQVVDHGVAAIVFEQVLDVKKRFGHGVIGAEARIFASRATIAYLV